MIKKTVIVTTALISTLVIGAEPVKEQAKQLYSEDIEIVNNENTKLAHINVYGEVTLSEGVSSDEVINLLIARMAAQSKIYDAQMKQAAQIVQVQKQQAERSINLALEIVKTYAPPPAPKAEPKKEEPKKGWFNWFGKKKDK